MHYRYFQICIVFLLVVPVLSHSGANEKEVHQEIAHLLQFIENSDCTFIRNGKDYDAAEAKAHIQKKYNYFEVRINATEDFIKYAATKSTMSGKPYKVRCKGREILCSDWLDGELQKFRNR